MDDEPEAFSGGAAAGIVVGVCLVGALVGYYCWRQRKGQTAEDKSFNLFSSSFKEWTPKSPSGKGPLEEEPDWLQSAGRKVAGWASLSNQPAAETVRVSTHQTAGHV